MWLREMYRNPISTLWTILCLKNFRPEGWKEKFPAYRGYVLPTHFQEQVRRGTWLGSAGLPHLVSLSLQHLGPAPRGCLACVVERQCAPSPPLLRLPYLSSCALLLRPPPPLLLLLQAALSDHLPAAPLVQFCSGIPGWILFHCSHIEGGPKISLMGT